MIMEGTRPLTGPALTNDLCGQYFKIKVNLFISALAKVKINAVLTLNILTALKGWVGLAPQGRGALQTRTTFFK